MTPPFFVLSNFLAKIFQKPKHAFCKSGVWNFFASEGEYIIIFFERLEEKCGGHERRKIRAFLAKLEKQTTPGSRKFGQTYHLFM